VAGVALGNADVFARPKPGHLACFDPLYRPVTYDVLSNSVKSFVHSPLNTVYFNTTTN